MKTRLFTAILILAAACGKDGTKTEATKPEAAKPEPSSPKAEASTRLEIAVTEKGFEPDDVKVPAGKPVTLVFTRKTDQTCAKEVIIKMADGSKIEKELPLDKPVEVAATFPAAGTVGYACGMDMVKGQITVQ